LGCIDCYEVARRVLGVVLDAPLIEDGAGATIVKPWIITTLCGLSLSAGVAILYCGGGWLSAPFLLVGALLSFDDSGGPVWVATAAPRRGTSTEQKCVTLRGQPAPIHAELRALGIDPGPIPELEGSPAAGG
jgi:hypothetical protein